MNTHAVPTLIADSYPIPAIGITGFRLWLLRLWQQRPEKVNSLLVYAGLKTFLQDKRILRENSEYTAWLINDVCNDEAVCIVHEKASGFLFFSVPHPKPCLNWCWKISATCYKFERSKRKPHRAA